MAVIAPNGDNTFLLWRSLDLSLLLFAFREKTAILPGVSICFRSILSRFDPMRSKLIFAFPLVFLGFTLIFSSPQTVFSQFGLEKKTQEKKPVEEEEEPFELENSDGDSEEAEKTETESKPKEKGQNGPKLGKAATKTWETGVKLTAVSRCTDIVTMITIPMDWPEQQVTIMEEKGKTSSDIVQIERREHKNGGLQVMVVKVDELLPGKTAEVVLTVKATRNEILPPDADSVRKLSIPPTSKIPKAYKVYLEKSPNIESSHSQFKKLYTTITKDIELDWSKIEAIYNYVRENIQYDAANKAVIGNSALETMKLKRGDCKEMTAVFIAICRAGKIPVRSVRIPGHCYVEFYMIDDDGVGYWFPCQVSGTFAFGGIPEMGPVLQKGDNFDFREFPREKFRFFEKQTVGKYEGEAPKCVFFGTQL